MQVIVAAKFDENELIAIEKTIEALDKLINEMEARHYEEIIADNNFTFTTGYLDEVACTLSHLATNDIELN